MSVLAERVSGGAESDSRTRHPEAPVLEVVPLNVQLPRIEQRESGRPRSGSNRPRRRTAARKLDDLVARLVVAESTEHSERQEPVAKPAPQTRAIPRPRRSFD